MLAVLSLCQVIEGSNAFAHITPVTFVRKRKYDEAKVKRVMCKIVKGKTAQTVKTKGPHQLAVLDMEVGALIQRNEPSASHYLSVYCPLPTRLWAIERNVGELWQYVLSQQGSLPAVDSVFNARFQRLVDIHIHDAHSANLRCERYLNMVGSEKRSDIEILCQAHRRATCTDLVFEILKPIDSQTACRT